MRDKFLTPRYLNKFIDVLPHAQVIKAEQSGHFPQEEEPGLVIHAIKKFMRDVVVDSDRLME